MEALRAGYLVRYTPLDDVVRELRQADRLGTLRNKLGHYQRPHVLIVNEVGYLRLEHGDANRFFQNRRQRRKQPDRYPSATSPRAAKGGRRRRLNRAPSSRPS